MNAETSTIISEISAALALGTQSGDVEASRLFCSIDDDDAFAVVSKRFPALMNYDARGNWVGSVSNENGWTP